MQTFNYCTRLFISACSHLWFKVTIATIITVGNFMFDRLLSEVMLTLLILVIFDFITALYAVYKTKGKIKSSGVFRSAVKTTIYFLLVSAGFLAERGIPLHIIDDTIIGFLVATELISILENIGKAGFVIPKNLVKKLKNFTSSQ